MMDQILSTITQYKITYGIEVEGVVIMLHPKLFNKLWEEILTTMNLIDKVRLLVNDIRNTITRRNKVIYVQGIPIIKAPVEQNKIIVCRRTPNG